MTATRACEGYLAISLGLRGCNGAEVRRSTLLVQHGLKSNRTFCVPRTRELKQNKLFLFYELGELESEVTFVDHLQPTLSRLSPITRVNTIARAFVDQYNVRRRGPLSPIH